MAAVSESDVSPPESICILGAPVSMESPDRSLARLKRMLRDPWDGACRHVVTLNPEYVIAARTQPDFASALRRSDLSTADGAGIVIAARLLGGSKARAVARLTGVDLCDHLARISNDQSVPIFLLGAGPGVADAAAAVLSQRHPQCTIAGVWAESTPDASEDESTLRRIAASGARIVLVAYGAPAQVVWIERNRTRLAKAGVRLAVGVGGSFDYISGRTPRAPRTIRRLGLEWLYRLGRDPRRWRRQLALPKFVGLVFVTWLHGFTSGHTRQ